jgi:hypothetical protein
MRLEHEHSEVTQAVRGGSESNIVKFRRITF